MRNQLNVQLCLQSLSQSIRSHIIDAQLYSALLPAFSDQEIRKELALAANTFAS